MEVIKKGNKPYIYYTKCEECGSITSFMKCELDWSHRLVCPVCKSTMWTDISLYENDPYLGDDEVKKEVEEYLANKEKTGAPNRKPAYAPKKKEDVNVKIDSDNINEIVNTIKSSDEYDSVLEKLLREVKVISDKVIYLTEGQKVNEVTSVKIVPYEGSKRVTG